MKPKPYEFSFETILERGEFDVPVLVVCRVESYAQSVGFDEPCRQREVTVIRTEHRGEPLSNDELEDLHAKAVDQLCFH